MSNTSHTSNESHRTCQASPPPQINVTASPLQKSCRLQQLPPSHSPLLLTTSRTPRPAIAGPLPASLSSSETSTHQSLQDQLKPSSLLTHCSPLTQPSVLPSEPQPLGLSPLFASEWLIRLKSSKKWSIRSCTLKQSTSKDEPTTDNCKLDWACSQFPMALSITRAK